MYTKRKAIFYKLRPRICGIKVDVRKAKDWADEKRSDKPSKRMDAVAYRIPEKTNIKLLRYRGAHDNSRPYSSTLGEMRPLGFCCLN